MIRLPHIAIAATAFVFAACEDKASGTTATADSAAATDTTVVSDGTAADGTATDTLGQDGTAKADSPAPDATTTDTAGPDVAPTDVAQDIAVPDVPQDAASADAVEVAPGNPCVVAGGTVDTATCCKATSDFPNLCAIGACGCSPDNSKATLVCKCPDGKCFDGKDCVKQ